MVVVQVQEFKLVIFNLFSRIRIIPHTQIVHTAIAAYICINIIRSSNEQSYGQMRRSNLDVLTINCSQTLRKYSSVARNLMFKLTALQGLTKNAEVLRCDIGINELYNLLEKIKVHSHHFFVCPIILDF